MNWLHAFILGVVQGCTEFFPVSSSAHLKIVKSWLSIPAGEETVFFDLACHVGTVIALCYYFRKEIWELFLQPRKLMLYFVALLPLVPAYFLLKPLRLWASQPEFLGTCLLITALILLAAHRMKKKNVVAPSWKDALWIGTAQSFALVPGISRSASTITGGVWRGLDTRAAVRFSFMLSIPAALGGTFLELLKLKEVPFYATTCSIGFGVSALVGLGVIRFAIPLLERGVFWPFAWYCLIVSILLRVL